MYSLNHHSSINLLKKCSKNISNTENGNSQFINYILKRGAVIYPASLSGAPIAKLHDARYHIRTREQMVKWYNRNIKRYVFRPATAHLIGIDCDIRPDCNGIDELAKIITGDFLQEYPHTVSPRGKHFYFISDNDYISTSIAPHVECKSVALITLPGSKSDKGRYTWQGSPANIQPIPLSLKKLLPVRNNEPTPAPVYSRGSLELDRIHNTLIKQGIEPINNNRNNYTFAFCRFSRRQGHSIDSVLSYLQFLISDDFTAREIVCTAKSAYRGRARS